MKITNYTDYLASLNNYSSTFDRKTDDIVLDIIQNVRQNGDTAIAEYSKKFDKVDIDSFIVSEAEIAEAKNKVSVEFISSMDQAAQNIRNFHEKQVEQSRYINKQNDIMLKHQVTDVACVRFYV